MSSMMNLNRRGASSNWVEWKCLLASRSELRHGSLLIVVVVDRFQLLAGHQYDQHIFIYYLKPKPTPASCCYGCYYFLTVAKTAPPILH